MKHLFLLFTFCFANFVSAQGGPGVCSPVPGSQFDSYSPYENLPRAIDRKIRRDSRHLAALTAAIKIYDLPDLDTTTTGQKLVDDFNSFNRALLFGYTFFMYTADPVTGLKYMILMPPMNSAEMPWILSIAGTQTAIDWIVDGNLGRSQFQRLSSITRLFTNCNATDGAGHPLASLEWVITGHSLGGGLARAIGYKIQRDRTAQGLMPLKMETITLNGFGAQELIQKAETYNTAIGQFILASNYFVDGDIVSRIGTHIGPTLKLPAGTEDTKVTLKERIRRHSSQNFKDIPPWLGVAEAPPRIAGINDMLKVGAGVGLFIYDVVRQDPFFDPRMNRIEKQLTDARDLLASTSNFAAKAYVKALAIEHKNWLAAPSNGVVIKARIRNLDAIINSL